MHRFIPITIGALFPLFYTLPISAQTLSANPQQVGLAAGPGATVAATQTVELNSGSARLGFTRSVRYLTAATPWLTVTATREQTPATLTLSADASKLTAGTYVAQVLISAGTAGTYVDVYFGVGSNGSTTLGTNVSGLTFTGQQGVGVLPAQEINIFRRGGGSASYQAVATSQGNWLSVTPNVGSAPGTLSVVAVPAGLPVGLFQGAITLIPSDGALPTVVPVTLRAVESNSGVTVLSLSQTQLAIHHQIGALVPTVQVVRVTSSPGAANYTVTTTAPWLFLTSLYDSTPRSVVTDQAPSEFYVGVNPGALPEGTYQGTITVSAAGAQNIDLPVSLTVAAASGLNAGPSSVVFANFDPALGPGSVTVNVRPTGGANLGFSAIATSSGSWLSVSPATGSTASGVQALTVTGDPTNLTAGTYEGVITLTVQGTGATLQIPVTMIVIGSQGANSLVPSSASFTLSSIAGNADPSATLQVFATNGAVAHPFTAAASSTSGWLSVTPFNSSAPAALTINVRSASVPSAGSYTGFITLTSLLTGEQTQISVTYNLAARALAASPAQLTFTQTQRGVAPPPRTLSITANTSSTYTLTVDAGWIQVSSFTGQTPATVTVSANPAGLAPGLYTGTIRITGPNNTVEVPVSLTIPEPSAPVASPAEVAFTFDSSGLPPQPASLQVGSTAESIGFSTAVSTETGGNWLSVSMSTGTTPATLSVAVDWGLLVPGSYRGSIRLIPADPTARTVTVPVSVTVSGGSAIQAVLHSATLAPSPVAPGLVLTLKGFGLGPSGGRAAAPTNGVYPIALAGVRVLFDGVAAPLLYVRNDQINAIAPYTIYGRASTRIVVESGTATSAPIDARVVDAVPGVYNVGGGRGQAAALNADGSVNSEANPASAGGVVVLFGTGEGQTDPPGLDGRVATELKKPLGAVTARVGGRPAEVLYFGSAPGQVAGVFQANLRIPAEQAPGNVLVEVLVGGVVSQSGVTVVVR